MYELHGPIMIHARHKYQYDAITKEDFREKSLITEETGLHLVNDETTWVVNSGASFHLTPDHNCFSSYRAGEHVSSRWGMKGHDGLSA